MSHQTVAAARDAAGDVWFAATSATSGPFGPYSMRAVRYAPDGTLLTNGSWNGGGSGGAFATALATDAAGGVRLVGSDDDAVPAVVRFDAAGTVVWASSVGTQNSQARAVAVGAGGESYVAGLLTDTSVGGRFALFRVEADGSFGWQGLTSDASHPAGIAESVAIDPHGDVIVAGAWRPVFVTVGRLVVVRKYTATGSVLWTTAWNETVGFGASSATSMHVDGGGNVYVGGVTQVTANATQAFVLALDRDGGVRWSRSFSGNANPNEAVEVGATASGSVIVAARITEGAYAGARIVRYDETSVPTCLGDGSTTACPCGNSSPSSERAGCTNSFGTAGRLVSSGASSLAADTLVLRGEGMTNASALYIQGDGVGVPPVFGDGLRCATGTVVRLSTRTNVAGASDWPGVGDPTVSVRGGVASAGVRTYQVWYPNSASFCTAAVFNLTNGLRVTWTA